MHRWVGVIIILAAVGGGAWWMASREAASRKQQQAADENRGGASRDPGGAGGAAEPRVAGTGPRGRAPDDGHPRTLTARQLRANPVRAAVGRDELIKHIRRAEPDAAGPAGAGGSAGGATGPGGDDEGQKAVLGKEEIQAAIRTVTPLMQGCYEQRLKAKKDLQGKSVLRFTIVAKDGKGSLDEGEIKSSTLDDLRLDTCMLHALTRASFPVPRGEGKVVVNYPFTFRSDKTKTARTPPSK